MSYNDGACLKQWYFDQCVATQKCHAADTGHDTPPRHSIQTHDLSVAVLSIGVEPNVTLEYTATHFNVFGQTRPNVSSKIMLSHSSKQAE